MWRRRCAHHLDFIHRAEALHRHGVQEGEVARVEERIDWVVVDLRGARRVELG